MPRTQPNRKRRCSYSKAALKQSFLGIKTAASPINTGAASYNLCSKKLKSSRLSKVRITKNGEAAIVKYLTNALGQRVFKGELRAERPPALPVLSAQALSVLAWLKTNFPRLYAQAQARLQAQLQAQIQAQLQAQASLGSAFVYADGVLPSWAVLGEYDNGSASGAGRTEYIWLPTEDGGAVPVGMFRNSKFFAIHPDHLGTPRLMTDATATPVWQWPYSAFGHNAPVGLLKPTTSASGTSGHQAHLLASQSPAAGLDLRYPGQYADEEAGQFYNYFRSYQPGQGRYTQGDPIGLAGGLNTYAYVENSPLMFTDPLGLAPGDKQFGINDPGFWKWWEQNKRDYGPFDKSQSGFNPQKPFDIPNSELAKDYQKEYEQCKNRDSGRGGKTRGGKPNINELMRGSGRSGGRGGNE